MHKSIKILRIESIEIFFMGTCIKNTYIFIYVHKKNDISGTMAIEHKYSTIHTYDSETIAGGKVVTK